MINREKICDEIRKIKEHGNMTPEKVRDLANLIYIKRHWEDWGEDWEDVHEEHMSRELAEKWAHMMKNEDGSTGGKWSMEQTTNILKSYGWNLQPAEFYVVMNAMYSDFVNVAKANGIDKPEFYASMARAWLMDKDAEPGKAMRYYEHIVKK